MKIKSRKTGDAQALLQKMQHVADSFVEGSDTTMSQDDVNDALAAANDALSTLAPAIRLQVRTAQDSINDAAAAVQACHNEEQAQVRASSLEEARQLAAEAQSCATRLENLNEAEVTQCAIAEDCLCDEARERT